MKKLSNKGFALVETLIVSSFVVGIFTLMYANFYPMIGEYEKRESFDDIDSTYNTYLVRLMIEKDDNKDNILSSDEVTCDYFSNMSEYCQNLVSALDIEKIYVINYQIDDTTRSQLVSDFNSSDEKSDLSFSEYIEYLPEFKSNPNRFSKRIMVQYNTSIVGGSEERGKSVYHYGTIGVK